MEKEDKYWIVESSYTLRYFKNGQFHREAGPAFLLKTDKNFNNYINLGDDHLYQDKRKQISIIENMEKQHIGPLPHSSEYYLEGIQYSKEEFYAIKIQKELEQELPTSKLNTKKVKV
jgi:hypothetical protein